MHRRRIDRGCAVRWTQTLWRGGGAAGWPEVCVDSERCIAGHENGPGSASLRRPGTACRALSGADAPDLPETDRVSSRAICLPVYSDMQAGELAKIIAGIIRCQRNAEAIKSKLERQIPSDWEAVKTTAFTDPYDRFIYRA